MNYINSRFYLYVIRGLHEGVRNPKAIDDRTRTLVFVKASTLSFIFYTRINGGIIRGKKWEKNTVYLLLLLASNDRVIG